MSNGGSSRSCRYRYQVPIIAYEFTGDSTNYTYYIDYRYRYTLDEISKILVNISKISRLRRAKSDLSHLHLEGPKGGPYGFLQINN